MSSPGTEPARASDQLVERVSTRSPSLPITLLRCLRPKQFIKNLLIFGPAIFTGPRSHKWILSPGVLPALVGTFALFCLMAGCTYIINDYVDLEHDRHNPAKRRRPLAAGEISPRLALGFALLGIPTALAVQSWWSWRVGVAFAVYLGTTLLYSFVLKRMVIIDLMTIAGLFVLRAYVGCLVLDAPLSMWFLSCIASLALFIAAAKRHHELRQVGDGVVEGDNARSVLREYNHDLVFMIMGVTTVGALLTYSFFTLTEGPPGFAYSVPFVVFGIFRFHYLALVRGLAGTPEVTLLQDRPLLVTVATWAVLLIYIYSRTVEPAAAAVLPL